MRQKRGQGEPSNQGVLNENNICMKGKVISEEEHTFPGRQNAAKNASEVRHKKMSKMT